MQPHTDNDPPPSPSPGTSFSASIAQRRLQRRPPPGLRLDMGASAAGTVAGAAGAASPTHLGADSEGPPPTAHGTWTMDGRPTTPALQPAPGASWDDSAPSTPRLGVPSGRVGLQQSRPIDVIGDFGVGSSDRGSADNVPYDAAGSPTSLQRHTGPLPSSTGVIPAQAAALAGATKDLSLNCGGIGAGEYRGPLARSQPVKQPRSRPLSRVTGLSYISAADMAARLGEAATSGRTGVIIDTRRSADYARARIATATNMSVSTTLAKRKTFTVDRLLEMQRVAGEQWRVVAGWKSAPWVILYGVGPPEETASEDTQLVLLARKFMAEAPEGCGIHVLQCGFDGFVRSHESLCTRGGDVTPSAAACTIPALSLQPASMSTGPLAPRRAARTGVPAVHPRPTIKIDHPMLRTMRQTPGGGFDPSEIVAMRLPHDFSSPPPPSQVGASEEQDSQQLQALPAYLRRAADPATGAALLTRLFGCIDASETRRMSSMIESNGMVTEKNMYTISVGLELGSKNRYTNIYPFDSNRVRLRSIRRPHEEAAATAAAMVAASPPLSVWPAGPRVGTHSTRPISFGVAQSRQPHRAGSVKRSSHQVESKSKGQLLLDDAESTGSEAEQLGRPPAASADRNDYVNASYISYFDGPLYIATQGPLPETVGDFWRMVWEEQARVIVMLTKEYENGRPKCHRYWPSQIGHTAMYGDLCVEWQVEAYHPDDASVIARRFRLSRPTVTQATMCVTHLQYVGWPDHGVPENPLGVLRLIHLARRAQGEDESSAGRIPMVVHCSAGCGRTGAFCVIDTIIQLDVADAGRDTPVPDTTLSPGTTTATGRHSTFTGMVPKALQSRGPSEAPVASGESPVQGWSPADAERSGDRQTLTQWTEKPPAELRDDLVFMVVSRFRELRITMVQTLRQFVFCHEALAWVALNAGPRPIDHVIDRRLVAEWNRMNHTELSEADCADITFLLRGRQEMVQAMLNSDIGGSTKGGSGNPAMAASSAAVSAGRASIDVVSGGGVPSDDFPMTSGPPAVKRSNTVGPVRRGFLASLFRPVEPATGGSGTGAGKSAQEQRLKPQTRVGAKLSSMAPAHAPIAEEEPTAVAPADAGHIAPTTPSPALSPASSRLLFGSTRVNGARPRSSVLLAPLVSSATSAIQESPDCDYFGLASATIESSARLASADSPVSPGGGWPRNGGTCSPHHNRHHHRRMASRGDNTPPTSPAYVGGTALASPSAR